MVADTSLLDSGLLTIPIESELTTQLMTTIEESDIPELSTKNHHKKQQIGFNI